MHEIFVKANVEIGLIYIILVVLLSWDVANLIGLYGHHLKNSLPLSELC